MREPIGASCGAKGSLLLLARRFPFNHGEVAAESYLETEIGLLAPHFDQVLAVGTEAVEGDVPTCALPGNVIPLTLGCGNSRAEKAALVAKGFVNRVSAPALVRDAIDADPVKGVERVAFRGYLAARAYWKYKRLVERMEGMGFVPTHAYSFWLYDTALAALWAKRAFSCVGAVARAHGYDLYRDRTRAGYLPFRELLLSELDAVLPCSEDGRAHIEINWPGHSEKLLTSYLGTADLPDRSDTPQEGVFHVVSCSRVAAVKRVGLIADALALLDAEGRRVRWTHYGDGPDLASVKKKCAGFSSVEVSFPGSVRNAELLRIYGRGRIDLFVNVSESEGLPISIMEACGVGAPVLATNVGGTGEIVEDGGNGKLLSANPAPEEIAQAIAWFMGIPEKDVLRMRRTSRGVWERQFRAAENVRQLLNLLKGGDAA